MPRPSSPLPDWEAPARDLRGLERLIRTAADNGAETLIIASGFRPVLLIQGRAKEVGERALPLEELRPLVDELHATAGVAGALAEGHRRASYVMPKKVPLELYFSRTAGSDLVVVTLPKRAGTK